MDFRLYLVREIIREKARKPQANPVGVGLALIDLLETMHSSKDGTVESWMKIHALALEGLWRAVAAQGNFEVDELAGAVEMRIARQQRAEEGR